MQNVRRHRTLTQDGNSLDALTLECELKEEKLIFFTPLFTDTLLFNQLSMIMILFMSLYRFKVTLIDIFKLKSTQSLQTLHS